jgi:hypothetical protein
MAISSAWTAGHGRPGARRIALNGHAVYACRSCRAVVRVTSAHYLTEECANCGAATWDENLRCTGPDCDAVRRPGFRGRAHCHACGHSVWALVSARRPAEV